MNAIKDFYNGKKVKDKFENIRVRIIKNKKIPIFNRKTVGAKNFSPLQLTTG